MESARVNGISAQTEGCNQHPHPICRAGTSHLVLSILSVWRRGEGLRTERQKKAGPVDLLPDVQGLGGREEKSWGTFRSLSLSHLDGTLPSSYSPAAFPLSSAALFFSEMSPVYS